MKGKESKTNRGQLMTDLQSPYKWRTIYPTPPKKRASKKGR